MDHAAGDTVLKEIARRLAGMTRGADMVARVGGDEFVAFAEVDDEHGAAEIAERMREALTVPMAIGEKELSVTASIGVAVSRDRTDDPATLLRDADKAMYLAKQAGRDHVQVFNGTVRDYANEQIDLESELAHAIDVGQLTLVYQPIFRLADGVGVGVEALVRWQHPERGLLQPDSFIPLAEASGLIVPLGAWVLTEACRQAASWMEAVSGLEPFTMWVNKSAGEFHRTDVVRSVMDTLAVNGLSSSRLGIEVTESVFMSDTERLRTTMSDMRAKGVSIAIDDFGTGFSSLGYLERFPIDILKIDRSFVMGIGHEPGTALVTACLAMAHSLGIATVAEGVESREQGAWLTAAGCDDVQGFGYCRPVDADAAIAILVSSRQGAQARTTPSELLTN
jgi:predicted signal transduction protein with EAL and GGDEF domain